MRVILSTTKLPKMGLCFEGPHSALKGFSSYIVYMKYKGHEADGYVCVRLFVWPTLESNKRYVAYTYTSIHSLKVNT